MRGQRNTVTDKTGAVAPFQTAFRRFSLVLRARLGVPSLPSPRAGHPFPKLSEGLNSPAALSCCGQGQGGIQRHNGRCLGPAVSGRLCTAPAEAAGCSPRWASPVGLCGSELWHRSPFETQLPAPGANGWCEPRTVGLGAPLLPEPRSRRLSAGPAPPRRRCGSRCPRPGSGTACATGRPRRGSSPGQDGFSPPVFLAGIHLPARRRRALHLRPPRARPRGRLPGITEGANSPPGRSLGPPRCSLPRETWRSGFPRGDVQYPPLSFGSRAGRSCRRRARARRRPRAPAAHRLPPAVSPSPARRRGGYCEVGKRESECSGLKIETVKVRRVFTQPLLF